MANCPPTPKSDKKEYLGFVRQSMVRWFDPGLLINAGIKALVADVFGVYADKRELQAALQHSQTHDYTQKEEVWIDYIADLGDGWNSTYTMAKLLAAENLTLERENQRIDTQRGRLLVMGGDQVYPYPGREAYNNRTVGPYRAALPCVLPSDKAPHLFAIPGNHDWYDGLTSFIRLFCQGRWIGGWKTQQSRSYFAIKLPHNWWLWGTDIQLESDIDKPQLDYFKTVAKEHMKAGDRVILCTAEPSWVYTPTKGPEAYHNLDYFEQNIIRKHDGVLKLTLTGDLHHYSRYRAESETRQKITAGGGGAYLSGTHQLPETLELEEGDVKVKYSRADATFPSMETSRRLRFGSLLFPLKNVGVSLLLGGFYLLYAWILQSASQNTGSTFMERIHSLAPTPAGILRVLEEFSLILRYSPASVLLLFALIGGAVAFCDAKGAAKFIVGGLHGIAHLLLNLALIWLFASLNLNVWGLEIGQPIHILLFIAEMLILGSFLGGLLMGIYIVLANLLTFHIEAAFASQSIADYKNFLRLHIDKDGNLTVYPVGVTKVCKKWRFMPNAQNGESWFEPAAGGSIKAHLIEGPIHIKGK